jgi:hypothetical protein
VNFLPVIHRICRILLLAVFLAPAACSSRPDQANVLLRKQIQDMQAQIDQLHRQHDLDQASILGLQSSVKTVPTLPPDELDQLFTAAGLQFGRLTGGDRPDSSLTYDTLLKVYVVPIDLSGDALKAAGTFRVELFDLNLPHQQRIGRWDFDPDAARQAWHGPLLYTYVLACPWQSPPIHARLLARVTYNDLLTHRIFTSDREVTVTPPPATEP